MDSIFSIGLGLGIRALIDNFHDDYKVSGTLIGLWEGVVLHHFLAKRPGSVDAFFALAFRLLIDLVVTESFIRFTIVALWAGVGLVFSDMLLTVSDSGPIKQLLRSLGLRSRSSSSSTSRRSGSNRISLSSGRRSRSYSTSRTSRSQNSAGTRRARSESRGPSQLQWPFFKSLASSRVHFYDGPSTAPTTSVPTNTVTASVDSGSSLGSSETVRSPRSILRSPPESSLGATPIEAPRRLRNDLVPGFWTETETVSNPPSVISRSASGGSGRSRMDAPMPTITEVLGEPSLGEPAVFVPPAVLIPKHTEELSEDRDSSSSFSEQDRYERPTVPAESPAPDDANPLDYLDEEELLRAPRVHGSRATAHIVVPPITVNRSEIPYIVTGPKTPTRMPDLRDIPELNLSTPSVDQIPRPTAERMPSLREIPEMAITPSMDGGASIEERSLPPPPPSRRTKVSSAPNLPTTRPMSIPPPYAEALAVHPPPPTLPSDAKRSIPAPEPDPRTLIGTDGVAGAQYNSPKLNTIRDSMASDRTSMLFKEVEDLRELAAKKEAASRRMDDELKKAARERRFHDALSHKVQKEDLEEQARAARDKAEQKLYHAHNRRLSDREVDVRGLRTSEAIRRTEKAIAEAYDRGEANIVVIVGPPDRLQIPALRPSLLKTLKEYKIQFRDDPTDPDQLLVSLPYPTIA